VLLALAPLTSRAEFRIDITGVGGTQIPVALGKFKDEARSPQPLSAIIRADLERAGLFKLLDASADRLDENGRPAFADWRTKGADALAAGSVTPLADGRYDIRYQLWDVLKGKGLGGLSIVVPASDLRQAAHRIADDIYEHMTRDKGYFASRIAYVAKTGPRYNLVIADSDGEGAQNALTSNQPIISPAWSADGNQLAYVSFERGKAEVFAQDVLSGRRRVVANFKGSNSAPAWSPDGRLLAVTLSRDGGSQLHLLTPDGEGVRRLTQSTAIDTEAAWSPDGGTLYFVSDRGGSPQIYKISAQGGEPQRVTFQGDYNISPAISPDGRSMAYISRVADAFRVHVMDLSTGNVRALTDTRDDESPSFAPNSREIIYATRSQGRDVLMMTSLDGRIKAKLATPAADVREPVWAPPAGGLRR
jgi:TolB protein